MIMPLGKFALQYVIPNSCRKVWLVFFFWFPALSEDQEKICWIPQNYLVALIIVIILSKEKPFFKSIKIKVWTGTLMHNVVVLKPNYYFGEW